MADHSGYTTLTKYIPVEFFIDLIKDDIKKLIHTYGHKNCGLRQEELCEKIKEIIPQKKKIIFEHMDTPSKKKWSIDWDSERSKHFDKLYKEEGFINMCFPKRYTNNPRLNQLLSKHIDFCKKKDESLSALRNKSEYNACKQHNMWIDSQRTSFTREYLKNAKVFRSQNVNKYFSTKEHPEGHDPLKIYLNSKLDCNLYNPPPKIHPKGPVEKAPTISLHSPAPPDLDQKSPGRGGKTIPEGDGGDGKAEKEKSDVKIPPKPETPASDSLASSQTKIKVDSTDNSQNADLKAKGTDLSSKDQGDKGKPNEATDTKAQSPEQLSEPKSSISSKDSPVDKVPNLPSSVIKGQDTDADATLSTTSATSDTTHSTQNVQSSLTPDVSLAHPQLPAVAADADHYSKEPTPDPVSKSTDQGASLTSALDPGLAPSQAATSNSSASETSSTTTSSTMTLTPSSSLAQDPHLLTSSTQTIVTTSIATTLTQTTTSVSVPPTITVSAIGTNPIPSIIGITSTTGGSEKANAPLKTIAGSQDSNIASHKNQDDLLQSNKGTSFPDALSSPTTPNSNVILLPDPSSGPPLPLPVPSPGLPHGVSPGGPAPVLPASHVVTKPDSDQIMTSPKDASQQSKDSTQVSSTSLPTGTQPSDKSIITPTKFPPLTSIIPTIDLRRIFEIPEKHTYESPNIAVHEWEDPKLVGKTVEKDVYIKLLKINRYKQKLQKKKKKNKKTLIEVHMEVLEEYKNDEWELHKGDFLEICLQDIQKQDILWNNWIENHRKILEQWKEKEWFHILKNKWRNEQQKYKEKNDKLQENILNEQEKHSIVSQKDIWKQWISKQATLIDMFNKEDWFKSIVCVQDKEKDNYPINEYNNISLTSKTGLKNEKMNHEQSRSKNIIQKLMVQIHMMVLEECIKEDIIKHKELCIDNFIEDIHNQNNYDEKRNITQCDTDDFNVLEFEEIHTSINK
ncbi:STP1 protein [Plasmodium ovale]|uniref:STP1 protein n=1 Tax=Plasmodium ovale TaxID=36330 RepID=A0A1D3JFM1_PLAOA|nr:STP1 protein [Plasmodium ovale]